MMLTHPHETPATRWGRPHLPPGARYALHLTDPRTPACLQKPVVYDNVAALARSLHRRRGSAPLQLADLELATHEAERPRLGVSVWTLDPATGDRRASLGWAYLGGAGFRTLEAALRAELPVAESAEAMA